jgi:uncharacterized protein YciW
MSRDLIEEALSPAARRWRARRPEARAFAAGSADALLTNPEPDGLPPRERWATALRASALGADRASALQAREALAALGLGPEAIAAIERGVADEPRLAGLLRLAERLTLAPASARRDDLAALSDLGLSPKEIVTASQIVAYLAFQTRVLAAASVIAWERGETP